MKRKNNITLFGEFEEKERKEILRNLSTLYETEEGTVPLDRSFGVNTEMLDGSIDVASNEYAVELITKTEIYEPRVEVESVICNLEGDTLVADITIKKGSADDE